MTASASPLAVIDQRYRVAAELGHGGMARVYRVQDERTGRDFALKKLVVSGEQSSTLRAMFEREFHTLAQLTHPNIVRVFDYGLDVDDPYYTMELLEGCDSHTALKSSELSTPEICSLLRDCASALGLIHSRRLVHRDVGPRNVWRTLQGRGKLIDFGTLVAMGPQSRIAGTPPYVPPEAMNAQPLDARCDLYALGALAYYLLTRKHAYPARALHDLPDVWRRKPEPPSVSNPEVPGALSELVMALLSLDVRARPSTAAEVYERLSAIAGLPVDDDQRATAQAFLSSPALVGRSHAEREIAKHLRKLLAERGGTLAIISARGGGRSRMLSEAALKAKLSGAVTVSVHATAVDAGPLSLATRMTEQLVDALPALPLLTASAGPTIGHLSPALHRIFGSPALVELPMLTRAAKLSAAIVQLFHVASQQRPVVIAIDDVHRSDSASLAALGRLALLATERHRLLVMATCDSDVLGAPPPVLQSLIRPRHRVDLGALLPEETRQLLESLFGAVPGLDQAAELTHEVTGGNPQACMQYAQYLVDNGVARYERGQWLLPLQLRDCGLPTTLEAMLEQRLAAVSGDARTLALGLALGRDESRSSWQPETHVRLEDHPRLLDDASAARALDALDELLRADIVVQRDLCYVVAQRAMVDVLVRTATESERERAHGRLARIFGGPGYKSSWLAVRQMVAAGDCMAARRAILAFAAAAANRPPDWSAMRISLHAQCSRAAVDHWQAHGGSPVEGIILRRVLLTAVAVYDWRLARYGDAQLAQLHADCGWKYWPETDPKLSDLERISVCLQRAQKAYEAAEEAQRGLSPLDALRELGGNSMLLCRAYVASFDVARVRALVPPLEVLRPLSPALALIADVCKLGVDRATGHRFGDALLELATRVRGSTDLPELLRLASAALNIHEQALEDARIGRRRALELIDFLALGGAHDELFIVLHGRWLGHGFLGNAELARSLRKRAEIITEDDVWRRKAYLFIEAEYFALAGELHPLTRVEALLAELAEIFEGFRAWLSYARAAMYRLRGELGAARLELERGLAQATAGEHRAWIALAPAYAELLLSLGDPQAAEHEACELLEQVRAKSLDRSCEVAGLRILALVLGQKGQREAAEASIAQAMALASEMQYGGLPLAKLYESQAQVALWTGDLQRCIETLGELWPLIERSEARSLLLAYETLREESSKLESDHKLPSLSRAELTPSVGSAEASTLHTDIRTMLISAGRREDRASIALKLLLNETGAVAGHLFLLDANGLFAAGVVNDVPTSAELVQRAQEYFDVCLAAVATVTEGDDMPARTTIAHGTWNLTPVLLEGHTDESTVVTGLAMLATNDNHRLRAASNEVVALVSQCLLAAGDTVAVSFEE